MALPSSTVCGLGMPNGWRLSSAALKNDSFHNPRAAFASAACYAGAQLLSNPLSSPLRRLHLGDCRTRRASAPSALPRTTLRTKTRRLTPPPRALSMDELALLQHQR